MENIQDISWNLLEENKTNIEVSDVASALIKCVHEKGLVDIEYISDISSLPKDEVINKLKGSIYQNPDKFQNNRYLGFELSDEYLSGNLYYKLKKAREANKLYHIFDSNIEALESVMPEGVKYDNIYYTLSSPWITYDIVLDFIKYLYKSVSARVSLVNQHTLFHDDITKTYEINIEGYVENLLNIKYGTSYRSISRLLDMILNNKKIAVYDYLTTGKNKKKAVLNKKETLLAQNICEQINLDFHTFIESSLDNIDRLHEAYNSKYGYNVSRIYNGDFLTFPNLNKNVTLFKYQSNAVARILFNQNTLLAHNVGAGKTYIMVCAGEELLRTKLSSKNLYVVPNNIVNQWANFYKELYPLSNILVVDSKDFTKTKKEETLKLLKSDDHKTVIMPYSVFDRIPLSLKNEIDTVIAEIKEIASIKDPTKMTSNLVKRKRELDDRLQELNVQVKDPLDYLSFDNLGFTRLFLDEAHNYKNIKLHSDYDYFGLSMNGSTKCKHLTSICDYMHSKGYGCIFATGTPITNSISDCYAMQRYLQPGELKLLDLYNFDEWVAMFAEAKDEIEIDVDTNNFRVMSRLSKFHNLTELTSVLSNICDFHFNKNDKGLPKFNGYTNITISKSNELNAYLQDISKRVEDIRAGRISRKDDNMLKVTTDGRKAALDLRLIDYNKYQNITYNKVFECADVVSGIYYKYESDKYTQAIFCDSSTPKDGFNVYDELKKLLMNKGIPSSQIAFIHDATSDIQREKLFESINKGDIRIVIGSTFKLGTGVNIQERLVAIHHLDIPWRPSDMVQREGRILRPGNNCSEVYIYKYIQESSFDAYSWQILETKQNFINELLSNSLSVRTLEDVEDTKLTYAEVKALAIGNPRLKEVVDVSNSLNKLKILDKRENDKIVLYKTKLLAIPESKKELNNIISNLKLDIEIYNNNNVQLNEEERSKLRNLIWDSVETNLFLDEDKYICTYQGFKIYVPKNVVLNQYKVEIRGFGVYACFLETNLGTLTKIDNILSHLEERLTNKRTELNNLKKNEATYKESIANRKDYSSDISFLENKLEMLNKDLMNE